MSNVLLQRCRQLLLPYAFILPEAGELLRADCISVGDGDLSYGDAIGITISERFENMGDDALISVIMHEMCHRINRDNKLFIFSAGQLKNIIRETRADLFAKRICGVNFSDEYIMDKSAELGHLGYLESDDRKELLRRTDDFCCSWPFLEECFKNYGYSNKSIRSAHKYFLKCAKAYDSFLSKHQI